MILKAEKYLKKNIIPGIFAVFFILVFALCPIVNSAAADKNSKESGEKSVQSEQNSEDKTNAPLDTLYEYEKPTLEDESYGWLVFKTILVLGLLVGGFYYFYRFVTKKTGIQMLGRDVVKILSITPVGQNKFLQVIDLAGRIMVIGVSDSGINLITEIQDRNEIDKIRLLSSKSTPVQPGGFQEYISKYIGKILSKVEGAGTKRPPETHEETEIDRLDYLKRQRERLKKINGKNDEM